MDHFRNAISLILHTPCNMTEAQCDEQLAQATQSEMLFRLRDARDAGRHGWWDKDVCSIDDLRGYREKALVDNDHVSVINFTAMIAARETQELEIDTSWIKELVAQSEQKPELEHGKTYEIEVWKGPDLVRIHAVCNICPRGEEIWFMDGKKEVGARRVIRQIN